MKYQYSEYKFHFPIVFLKAAGSSSVQCRLPSQSHCECHSTLLYASLPITSHLHSQAAASCDIILALGFATQTQWLSPQGGERPVACWAAVLIQTDFRVNAPAQEMQLPLDTLGLTLSQNIQWVSIYMAFIFERVGSCSFMHSCWWIGCKFWLKVSCGIDTLSPFCLDYPRGAIDQPLGSLSGFFSDWSVSHWACAVVASSPRCAARADCADCWWQCWWKATRP